MMVPQVLSLTFEDGPDPATAQKVLDVLKYHQVPATYVLCELPCWMGHLDIPR